MAISKVRICDGSKDGPVTYWLTELTMNWMYTPVETSKMNCVRLRQRWENADFTGNTKVKRQPADGPVTCGCAYCELSL